MAALTAASWTVTVAERGIMCGSGRRYSRGTMVLAGTDTYPTGGIPLPAIGKFGMYRQLDQLLMIGQDAATTQYLTTYDKTNAKLQLFEDASPAASAPFPEVGAAQAPGPRTYNFYAQGW